MLHTKDVNHSTKLGKKAILRDKTMCDKLIYIPNDDEYDYPMCLKCFDNQSRNNKSTQSLRIRS